MFIPPVRFVEFQSPHRKSFAVVYSCFSFEILPFWKMCNRKFQHGLKCQGKKNGKINITRKSFRASVAIEIKFQAYELFTLGLFDTFHTESDLVHDAFSPS